MQDGVREPYENKGKSYQDGNLSLLKVLVPFETSERLSEEKKETIVYAMSSAYISILLPLCTQRGKLHWGESR